MKRTDKSAGVGGKPVKATENGGRSLGPEGRVESLDEEEKTASVDALLARNPALWRGCEMAGQGDYGQSTGYPQLDDILPGRGWPRSAMMEIISSHWGMGELQLLIPLMRKVVAEGKWILWISPPYLLYAPALVQAGINTQQVLVVKRQTSCKDALWSMEKALQTDSCGLVLAWQNWLSGRVMRRLQLAAENGKTLGVLFHHNVSKRSQSSLAIKINKITHENSDIGEVVSNAGNREVTVVRARGNFRPLSARLNLHQSKSSSLLAAAHSLESTAEPSRTPR